MTGISLRRLRQDAHIRALTRGIRPHPEQFIQPLFVVEGIAEREVIPGLTGVYRETPESLLAQIESDLAAGVSKFLLFGVPAAHAERGIDWSFTSGQIAAIKQRFGNRVWLTVDVCLCSSTTHGHCGVLNDSADHLDNAASVEELVAAAVSYAKAGADCVAPSDMMDGRIGAIREALDAAGLERTVLMSYSAKFHSSFYGPFRVAADSAPKGEGCALTDRASYQIDPSRANDALLSVERDVAEGADILMVKPGMPYLDILADLSRQFAQPWAVYEVSGEYAGIELPADQGLADRVRAHREAWSGFVRAGASMIISYGARHAKEWLPDMTISDSLFERAKRVSPGGVHSPVRAFKGVGGTPRFMTGGAGAYIRDVDGRDIIDFCMAFGPLILGHGNEPVKQAALGAIDRGWSLGTAEPYSLALAEFITARIPWVESLRFVTSGTEAVMSALRVARGATKRDLILKFDGCYHGHADSMLIRSGSGLAEASEPDSAGIDQGTVRGTLVAPLDDEAALEAIFAKHGGEIAAAIIEPVPANYGLLLQRTEFLKTLAALCRKHGSLLILDEVISGFRLGFTGAAGLFGIEPDLVTYGKVIGGGFPVGAYGGKRQYMELVAPVGPVYQAGTLAANPVAMCAGLAALEQLADGQVHAQLEKLGTQLDQQLGAIPGLTVQRIGSLFWICLAANAAPIRSLPQLKAAAGKPFGPVFHRLLDAGIYLAPSAFEVGFLSAAHTEAHVATLAQELRAALA